MLLPLLLGLVCLSQQCSIEVCSPVPYAPDVCIDESWDCPECMDCASDSFGVCLPMPCCPDAMCQQIDRDATCNGPVCKCSRGFTGLLCQEYVGYCNNNDHCQHGGTCIGDPPSKYCSCTRGMVGGSMTAYGGTTCEKVAGSCANNGHCLNGGACVGSMPNQQCACARGYVGSSCEFYAGKCTNDIFCQEPGDGGALCLGPMGTKECVCTLGRTTEYDVSPCADIHGTCVDDAECNSHGTCIGDKPRKSCDCDWGYTGRNCEVSFKDCRSYDDCNAADLAATCSVDPAGMGTCVCTVGFTGANCETKHGLCATDEQCQSADAGATCEGTIPTKSCVCSIGYIGELCEEYVGLCSDNLQCRNGRDPLEPTWLGDHRARCLGPRGEKECSCHIGVTGVYCDVLHGLCLADSQCQNTDVDAACVGERPSKVCACSYVGYTGVRCETFLHGRPTFLEFTREPPAVQFDVLFDVDVRLVDDGQNTIVTDSSSTVIIELSTGPGTLSGVLSATLDLGHAKFRNLSIDLAGEYGMSAYINLPLVRNASAFFRIKNLECPRGMSLLGQTCQPCPKGTFDPGSGVCRPCPTDHYSLEGAHACLSCIQGANCSRGVLKTNPGQWYNPVDGIVYDCAGADACPGGEGAVSSCNEGHDPTSILCGSCTEGYARAGEFCDKCASDGANIFALIVYSAVIVAIGAAASFAAATGSTWWPPVRIVLGFMQLSATTSLLRNGRYSPLGQAMLWHMPSIASYSILPLFCVSNANPLSLLPAYAVLGAVALIAAGVGIVATMKDKATHDDDDDDDDDDKSGEDGKETSPLGALVVPLMIVQPAVIKHAVEVQLCRTGLLVADMKLQCPSATYSAPATLVTVLFGFFVPVGLIVLMQKKDVPVLAMQHQTHLVWWEAVRMVRSSLLMVAVTGILSRQGQITLFATVLAVSVAAHLQAKPWRGAAENMAETVSLCSTFCVVMGIASLSTVDPKAAPFQGVGEDDPALAFTIMLHFLTSFFLAGYMASYVPFVADKLPGWTLAGFSTIERAEETDGTERDAKTLEDGEEAGTSL